MAMIVVLHRVRDHPSWRRVHDDFAPQQKAGGVTAESVYRAKDDPNNVLALHTFQTMAEAEAFVANPDLRAAMQRAGVEGQPRIEFYEEAERAGLGVEVDEAALKRHPYHPFFFPVIGREDGSIHDP